YHEFACSVPDEVNTAVALLTLPDGPPVVEITARYDGDLQRGEEVFRPLRQFGRPLVIQITPMTYIQLQHWLDPLSASGFHYYETGHFMADITEAAADILWEFYKRASAQENLFMLQQLGNTANRVSAQATAFGHREAKYSLAIV